MKGALSDCRIEEWSGIVGVCECCCCMKECACCDQWMALLWINPGELVRKGGSRDDYHSGTEV